MRKATHTAVAIVDDEGVIDLVRVLAFPGQAYRLVAWANGFTDRVWAGSAIPQCERRLRWACRQSGGLPRVGVSR